MYGRVLNSALGSRVHEISGGLESKQRQTSTFGGNNIRVLARTGARTFKFNGDGFPHESRKF